jgi:hypothetical protein
MGHVFVAPIANNNPKTGYGFNLEFWKIKPIPEDEYQSCSGEEMAIVYRHGETINDEARRDDDGAAIPCIVWKRAAVWRAVEPATVARRV